MAVNFKFVLDDPLFGNEYGGWGLLDRVARRWYDPRPAVGKRSVLPSLPPSPIVSPVVISELPETILPTTGGAINPIGPGGPLAVPKGWETVVIGGVERVRVPDVYNRGSDPVLEPFDPNVVIGEVQDEQPTKSQEDDEMAHDWGHLLRQGVEAVATNWWAPDATATPGILPGGGAGSSFVDAIALGTGGPGVTPSGAAATCEPCGPRYLTYDCKTGKFTKKRRRGRRRLATDRDLSDLAAIVAITGKGSAMNQAVAGMVRR